MGDRKEEQILKQWLQWKRWRLAPFQRQALKAYAAGKSGLVNAPTGSGKTYALWIPVLMRYIRENPSLSKAGKGLQVIWVTPLRALAKDLQRNMELACLEMNLSWTVEIRTGDTASAQRLRQRRQMPDALVTTPESLHVLMAGKDPREVFRHVHTVVVDEWHELLGTKRGVQTELVLAALRSWNPELRIWGISATIGNLEEARRVLLGNQFPPDKAITIRSGQERKIRVQTLMPPTVAALPWAGYMGIQLLKEVMEVVLKAGSVLLFTNTRSQTEIWYHAILDKYPELAGLVAIHHGSLDRELRDWVEESLHSGKLRLVICTSSLDLGVDFRPVETVIQVGSPKSIARFVQRAGRSGHRPGAESRIYFVPTHALELIEAVSLKDGVEKNVLEDRQPVAHAFDVLAQWMVTRAVGGGFDERLLFDEVRSTHAFQFLDRKEWEWLLGYITTGSAALHAYDEFKKVERYEGLYLVKDRRIARRHLFGIGTIVSESALKVKMQHGKYLGTVEEYFASRLRPGDVFWFAGMAVEFIRIHELTVTVKKSYGKKGYAVRWMGGRIPLSSQLSVFIRKRLEEALENPSGEEELARMRPLLELQSRRSAVPSAEQLLIEQCETQEGFHIFMFPFEGRLVHEGMAALLAYRISCLQPVTFSVAMNDYGFELLSDQLIPIEEILKTTRLFSTANLVTDIYHTANATEMAKRKFRDIAVISGLTFTGYPGNMMKAKQLQSSVSLMFQVLSKYEDHNLFILQTYQEVLTYQLEEGRLRTALDRIGRQEIVIRKTLKPTPLAFPILVDRLREQLSSEKLEDQVRKMMNAYGNAD